MINNAKVAVVGVGNNTSALVQGIAYYRATGSAVGVRSPSIGGLGAGDIDVVARDESLLEAFTAAQLPLIGDDLAEAAALLKSPPGTAV